MEEMIYSFFAQYGWQLTLIACSGILALGILKIPQLHLFDKIAEGKRKYLYAAISSLLSIATAAIYLLVIHNFEWIKFGFLSLGILGVNQTVYFVYENSGARALVRKLGKIALSIFIKTKVDNPETAKEIEQAGEQVIGLIDDLPKDKDE